MHSYFKRNQQFKPSVAEAPNINLGISVVIPSYNEPSLWRSLQSLASCEKPSCSVEVLVVVNYPENSAEEIVTNALECIEIVQKANAKFGGEYFSFFPLMAFNLPKKHAGVGLARQRGMDEAAWRFQQSNANNKIIACFDADATCSSNYLVELEKLWKKFPETEACSIRYEHPVEGNDFDERIYFGIAQYELHLRYYVQASRFVGHPFSFHTIGSSMACSAEAYLRYGGMNRHKAGEDFYFLQKIIPHGKFRELNSCCVYPSPRPSYRVPFGTGRAMTKYLENNDENYLTYNFDSWLILKPFFQHAPNLYNASKVSLESFMQEQHESLRTFLQSNNFVKAVEEVQANTSNPEAFKKRFFQWFDAFMLLKFMNFANENYYVRKPILSEAKRLAQSIGIKFIDGDSRSCLYATRDFEIKSAFG
ncbi:MAG TPA: glycosyltransferase family A protein [Tenuifilaceae bacterium]|nr:glycosyltransferase family A protein [Tenuifilaceae bacterium]HPE18209.1 glycosyltransferase family A protein [Tenuifilaceae bacterium]HPJ45492.1 glycosyltransferase family A protein [Tenuifilaceae bacterium]HPQ33899.1 glycosyltransferase family A protein [Tenuifilaceae bacterium]HRX68640.1 glycosyltransferase family A protein [Tenuifilaceae bacterium]